ncbi:MAG TPA: NAD(P)-dependent oxidoreductase [Rectinemataceae bacterium]
MTPGTASVGFIGLGVMGGSMASHILEAGYRLLVNTRSPEKASALIAKGAIWKNDAASLAAEADIIVTMVGYPREVEALYFGHRGIIDNAKPGALLVDMSTSSPELAVRIHAAAGERGLKALDAPVSGGDSGARNATLTIMVGGDEAAFEAAKPILGTMGKTIILQGGPGSGQHTKMANQIAVAGSLFGTVEAIAYAERAGLDPARVLLSISQGSAGSWQMSSNGKKILARDFGPGFFVKHFLKDLGIALEAARSMKLDLPVLALAEGLYRRLTEKGLGDEGTQVLYKLYTGELG